MSNLRTMLTLVRARKVGFGEFFSKTRSEFRAMACHLMRRWTPPEWHTADDVEQDLYFAAWKHIWWFDPSRGVAIDRYIVYNAMSGAKIQIHKARGVTISGSPDRKPSNIETPLTFFGDDGEGEALMSALLAEAPRAEEALIDREEQKRAIAVALKACETPKERTAVLAIREAGSLDMAGRLLYDDIDHRLDWRLGSEERADRFVIRYARAVAERVAQTDT